MNPIATWKFQSAVDLGGTSANQVQTFVHSFLNMSNIVVVDVGQPPSSWGGKEKAATYNSYQIFSLGNGQVQIMQSIPNQYGNQQPVNIYWNADNYSGYGLLLSQSNQYPPSNPGPVQAFTLTHLGGGTLAFRAAGGANAGKYLSVVKGVGYSSQDWQYGGGSFTFVSSAVGVMWVSSGSLVAILAITNSAYNLNLSQQTLVNPLTNAGLDLTNADMRGCTLTGANLSPVTSLQAANFSGAIFDQNSNLAGLTLTGANWTQANFTGADLTKIASASGAVMEGAILDGALLQNVDLSGARLKGVSLRGAHLDNANLSNADLTGADLTGATLSATNLQGAILQGTKFDQTDLSTTIFDAEPNFTRTSAGPIGRTTFVGTNPLPFAVLGSNWSYLDLTEATITNVPTAIPGLVADEALLPDNLLMSNVDFTAPVAPGNAPTFASFQGARMYGIVLNGANLQGAQLQDASLQSARLIGTNLTLANLTRAYLITQGAGAMVATPANISHFQAAVLESAFLFNAVLDYAHCDGVNFTNACFANSTALSTKQSASAVGATFNLANFTSSTLVQTVFDGSQLTGATFAQACLVGASLKGSGTNLAPYQGDVGKGASLTSADLRGTNFTGADMDGVDMTGAICSQEAVPPPAPYTQQIAGYGGKQSVLLFCPITPTLLGNTNSSTICPAKGVPSPSCTLCGPTGPCKISSSSAVRAKRRP